MISLDGFDACLARRRVADDRHRPCWVCWLKQSLVHASWGLGGLVRKVKAPETRSRIPAIM